jgi:hypothetical protein
VSEETIERSRARAEQARKDIGELYKEMKNSDHTRELADRLFYAMCTLDAVVSQLRDAKRVYDRTFIEARTTE